MPNPSVRSSTTTQSSTSASVMVDVPAGVQDGDTLLTFFIMDKNSGVPDVATLAGWILLDTAHAVGTSFEDVYGWVFYRIASSEPASYTWSLTNNDDTAVICTCIQNTNGAAPTVAHNQSTTDGTSMDAPSVTAGAGDLLYCWWGEGRGGAWTLDASLTQDKQANNSGGVNWAYSISGYATQSAGATGTKTTTFGSTSAWVAFSVLLTNAASGTTYNESGTGGFVVGGSASDVLLMTEAANGGVVLGNTTDGVQVMNEFSIGGFVIGGTTDSIIMHGILIIGRDDRQSVTIIGSTLPN